jgi:hypothetical protein
MPFQPSPRQSPPFTSCASMGAAARPVRSALLSCTCPSPQVGMPGPTRGSNAQSPLQMSEKRSMFEEKRVDVASQWADRRSMLYLFNASTFGIQVYIQMSLAFSRANRCQVLLYRATG